MYPQISALDVVATYPMLTAAEAEALAQWYRRPEFGRHDVDALDPYERDALLEMYFGLLAATSSPRLALLRALAGEQPDDVELEDPNVARVFPRALAATRRLVRAYELRAAGFLALALARRSRENDAA